MTPKQRVVLIYNFLDALTENDPEGTAVLVEAIKDQVTRLVTDVAVREPHPREIHEEGPSTGSKPLLPGESLHIRNNLGYECRVRWVIEHGLRRDWMKQYAPQSNHTAR